MIGYSALPYGYILERPIEDELYGECPRKIAKPYGDWRNANSGKTGNRSIRAT